ncbi:MAG: type 2 isopentenyl-diphosphate Delta-isomerase [Anaerolineae bacterium]|nr:type 2 isopentenyl-diphosphate Delta-isomerase [Anaerolineae bacterium]
MDQDKIEARKRDHLFINLNEDVSSTLSTGFETFRFVHQALPELNFDDVDTTVDLFGKRLKVPLFISSMTGGTAEAFRINCVLAEAAQTGGIAMGLGSQRAGLDHPDLAYTYQVRKYAPDILLFANLGAVQLNYAYTLEHCQRAVDMVQADALILHLNPLQEALQPGGNTRFSGLLRKIEMVCRGLQVPVIVKEVGWGISEKVARQLAGAGVAAIDVAGAGGTSWSQVEMYRLEEERSARVAARFAGWGIPTAESIMQVKQGAPDVLVFSSGGLKSGIDIAKSIALGAVCGGVAGVFLKAAHRSLADVLATITEFQSEIRLCMFATGARNIEELGKVPLIRVTRG